MTTASANPNYTRASATNKGAVSGILALIVTIAFMRSDKGLIAPFTTVLDLTFAIRNARFTDQCIVERANMIQITLNMITP